MRYYYTLKQISSGRALKVINLNYIFNKTIKKMKKILKIINFLIFNFKNI